MACLAREGSPGEQAEDAAGGGHDRRNGQGRLAIGHVAAAERGRADQDVEQAFRSLDKNDLPVIAGALVMLQGIGELVRCVVCLKTGEWPSRLKDVAETDVIEEHDRTPEEHRRNADGAQSMNCRSDSSGPE